MVGVLALAASVYAAPSAQAGRLESYGLMCGLKAGDLVTTEIGLNRPGVMEGNPLMRNQSVRLGYGAGVCVVTAEADHKLRKHKKSRWVYRAIVGGLMVYAIQNNARVGK